MRLHSVVRAERLPGECSLLYQSTVAVTNCHKLSSLQQCMLQIWRSKVQSQSQWVEGKVAESQLPSGGSWGQSLSLASPASTACIYSLVQGPFLHMHSWKPGIPLLALLVWVTQSSFSALSWLPSSFTCNKGATWKNPEKFPYFRVSLLSNLHCIGNLHSGSLEKLTQGSKELWCEHLEGVLSVPSSITQNFRHRVGGSRRKQEDLESQEKRYLSLPKNLQGIVSQFSYK